MVANVEMMHSFVEFLIRERKNDSKNWTSFMHDPLPNGCRNILFLTWGSFTNYIGKDRWVGTLLIFIGML